MNKPSLSIVVPDPHMIEIDRGIPIPPLMRMKSSWPFDKMKVGDSFFVDKSRKAALKSAVAVRHKRRVDRFTMRTKEHGVRVWRVK